MSEKMREALQRFIDDAIVQDLGGADLVYTSCESLEMAEAALRTHENGGQESEAVTGDFVLQITNSDQWFDVKTSKKTSPTSTLSGKKISQFLGIAPPSSLAIETAAIMRAAEVMDEKSEAGCTADWFMAKTSILALIPQDGRTQLEEFGMNVAQAVSQCIANNYLKDGTDDEMLRAIVTNIIGETKDTKGVGE